MADVRASPHRRRARHHRRDDRASPRPTTATRSAGCRRAPTSHVERAVRRRAAGHGRRRCPPWQRAEILDRAAVAARRAAARSSPAPSPRRRPSRSRRPGSRPPARVDTFQFAAAEARTLAGEMVPLDAAQPGEGKLGFTLRVPVGVVGAISPFNFPLNLVAHKLAPAIAAGCPVVLKPAQPDAAVGHRARRAADRRVRAAAGLAQRRHRRRRLGRQRHRRPPRRRHDHVHRLARRRLGHPRPGRRARRSASSSATTRR